MLMKTKELRVFIDILMKTLVLFDILSRSANETRSKFSILGPRDFPQGSFPVVTLTPPLPLSRS